MAAACPACSDSTPGYAPGVSIIVTTGKPRRSASAKIRRALA